MWFILPKTFITFLSILAFLSTALAGDSNDVITVTIQACPASPTGLSSNGGALSSASTSPAVPSYSYASTSESSRSSTSVASSFTATSTKSEAISSATVSSGSSLTVSGTGSTSTCTTFTAVSSSTSLLTTISSTIISSGNGTPTTGPGSTSPSTTLSSTTTTKSSSTTSTTVPSQVSSSTTKPSSTYPPTTQIGTSTTTRASSTSLTASSTSTVSTKASSTGTVSTKASSSTSLTTSSTSTVSTKASSTGTVSTKASSSTSLTTSSTSTVSTKASSAGTVSTKASSSTSLTTSSTSTVSTKASSTGTVSTKASSSTSLTTSSTSTVSTKASSTGTLSTKASSTSSSTSLTTSSTSTVSTTTTSSTSLTTSSPTTLSTTTSTSTSVPTVPTSTSTSTTQSTGTSQSSNTSGSSTTVLTTASTATSSTTTSTQSATSSTGSATTSVTITSSSTSSSSLSSTTTSTQTSTTTTTVTSTSLTTTHSSATSSPLTTSSTSSTRTSSTSTTSTSTSSSPTSTCDYWLEDIKHQGIAPFNSNKNTYQVFRNVKDYGAKGNGAADDTAAINLAISSGNRCGPASCNSSTTTPAVVYFPPGTYLVSGSIIDYYYTQIIGNPKCLPVIKGASNFNARWIIDGDQYQAGGALGFGNLATNVFWRQIRNFIIDLTAVPSIRAEGANAGSPVAGIHWPTAQATSLQNIVFLMSESANTGHEGVFLESGSGGFMTDLVFYGGQYGIEVANQQFTMRNLTFYNANTAIHQLFDWGWTYKGVSINNCSIGLDMTSLNKGVQSVGSVVLIDSEINNTPIGIAVARDATSTPATGGTLVLENVHLDNVGVAVQAPGAKTVLAGSAGATTITGWAEGNVYLPNGPTAFQGAFTPNTRPAALTSGIDYYERSKPQYETALASDFLSIRAAGAKGDGVTDDTNAIIAAISQASSAGKILFFDAGYYLVTKTIYIPSGSRIVGETYPVILSSGSFFNNMNSPQPVVQIGKPGEKGTVEWSDMIVSTKGGQAGAILIQWNLDASATTPAGAWDVHSRIGGFTGSNLQVAQCPKTPNTKITSSSQIPSQCIAAFLDMHITKSAAGVYLENTWLWVADHDADDADLTQISVYAGRGLLIESSAGKNWLYGTAVEHHTLYQYQLSNTVNTFLGFIQTESPYYQPNPAAPLPFTSQSAYSDPVFSAGSKQSAWGLRVVDSTSVFIYGAGQYSFFSDYDVTCSNQGNGETCQKHIVDIENSGLTVYGLNTVGTTEMITLNGVDEAPAAANDDGFVSTIAIFRSTQ